MIKRKQKVDKFANFIEILRKNEISHSAFLDIAKDAISDLELDFDISEIENWQALGLDLRQNDGKISLATAHTHLNEQEFCVVDIESTGSIRSGQIIEIGAIKWKNGEQIGRFSTLVYAPLVPPLITELTGISQDMLHGAPTLNKALSDFREFLGRAVFVAHNVSFDFGFISQSLISLGNPPLLNRKLCTVDLAKRVIASQRYALDVLKEILGISNTHHRAFSDAISASGILEFAFSRLPQDIQTAEDLILFSKTAPSLQLPKDEVCEHIEF